MITNTGTSRFLTCLLVAIICAVSPYVYSISIELGGTQTVEHLIQLFSSWSGSPDDQNLLKEAANYIDYREMCKASLGQQNWNTLTQRQQQDWEAAFKALIERRYYPRWHRVFRKNKIVYGQETTSNGMTTVKSQIELEDSREQALWNLKKEGTFYRVVNLTVDGKDLVVRAGRRFQKRFQKYGFKVFMDWINAQIKQSSSAEEY